ncbi:hypothetical protein O6H91_04G005500 [Diphasiastrum complanatum]|uniref:Uncharacterized protein n=1 Tax=Diphasiastrum complanatum TaxID=34168 RepID=A0ACC2DU47_DIPCM|nr:hypothetical protein O6H91_04G005500 [Diphasiastrum complanatum]
MAFDARKNRMLCDLAAEHGDRSRKGEVDAPIVHLINRINLHPHFFTTSSCSGRITLFQHPHALNQPCHHVPQLDPILTGLQPMHGKQEQEQQKEHKEKKKKKGGDWLFVSHEAVDADQLIGAVTEKYGKNAKGMLTFRYEPFILALECANVDAAQQLVSCAIASGFRESGITSCKNRVIVAIRCSIRLEVPVAQDGLLLVSLDYLRFLTKLANDKMVANHQRTEKFFALFSHQFELPKQRCMLEHISECSDMNRFEAEKSWNIVEALDSDDVLRHPIGKALRQFPINLSLAKDLVNSSRSSEASFRSHVVKANPFLDLEDRQKKLLLQIRAMEKEITSRMPNLRKLVACRQRVKCSGSLIFETEGKTQQFAKKRTFRVSNSERLCDELEAHDRNMQGALSEDPPILKKEVVSYEHNLISAEGFEELGGHGSCRLTAAKAIFDSHAELLCRWGHTTCNLPPTKATSVPSLMVFGGYGGSGRHGRLNDLLLINLQSGSLEPVNAVNPLRPRMAHTACIIDNAMWVIGGREDPSTPLGDVLVFHLGSLLWKSQTVIGETFHPRHRHAAVAVRSKIYVFGGLSATKTLNDMYVLDTIRLEWSLLPCEGEKPHARHSHTLAAIGETLYVFGGYGQNMLYGDLYTLDLGTSIWKKERVFGELPCGRFSHSCTVMGHYLVFVGGCTSSQPTNEVGILDTTCMVWKNQDTSSLKTSLLVRHTANLVGNDLVVIGGGHATYNCHGQSYRFSRAGAREKEHGRADTIDRECDGNMKMMSSGKLDFLNENADQVLQAATVVDNAETLVVSNISSGYYANEKCVEKKSVLVMELDRTVAKMGKDALKELGWLDPTRRVKALGCGKRVAFPLSHDAEDYFKLYGKYSSCLQDEVNIVPCSRAGCESLKVLAQQRLYSTVARCLEFGGKVYESCLLSSSKHSAPPRILLQIKLLDLLKKHGLPNSLGAEMPKRWERLGDMAILPSDCLTSQQWSWLGNNLWTSIAQCLGVRKVARQRPIAPTGTRDSTMELLLGENGWVEHRENGILYSFDATKCMFSSGNVSERLRIAQFECKDETVVDLFAGIGYFVLPFLLRAGAQKVYACEWNPNALVALRYNLRINSVEDRCIVIEGDNRRTSPQGVANRVCLGLLPSSEESWEVAVKALRPEGGTLHVHGNVKDSEELNWVDYLLESIKCIAQSRGLIWTVSIIHVERVKWYAPHIRHLVADVKCSAVKQRGLSA